MYRDSFTKKYAVKVGESAIILVPESALKASWAGTVLLRHWLR